MNDGYGAGGFVDVDIRPQGTPAGPGLVDLHYTIVEGDRSFVERVNIVGNTRTKDKVLRREILVLPGDVYNTVRIDVSKHRLENLGYFEKVETFPGRYRHSRAARIFSCRWKRNGPVRCSLAPATARSIASSVSSSSLRPISTFSIGQPSPAPGKNSGLAHSSARSGRTIRSRWLSLISSIIAYR